MWTGADGVWAAGDIASFPLSSYGGERGSVGHWGLAMYLGRVAAINMMDGNMTVNTVPFFWTMQYGKSVRYAGYGAGWDDIIMEVNIN